MYSVLLSRYTTSLLSPPAPRYTHPPFHFIQTHTHAHRLLCAAAACSVCAELPSVKVYTHSILQQPSAPSNRWPGPPAHPPPFTLRLPSLSLSSLLYASSSHQPSRRAQGAAGWRVPPSSGGGRGAAAPARLLRRLTAPPRPISCAREAPRAPVCVCTCAHDAARHASAGRGVGARARPGPSRQPARSRLTATLPFVSQNLSKDRIVAREQADFRQDFGPGRR